MLFIPLAVFRTLSISVHKCTIDAALIRCRQPSAIQPCAGLRAAPLPRSISRFRFDPARSPPVNELAPLYLSLNLLPTPLSRSVALTLASIALIL